MIIGEYCVNPLQVFYGRCECVNNFPFYKLDIHVMGDDEVPEVLTQYIVEQPKAEEYMKLIDKCIAERKNAQLDGTLHNDGIEWEED